MSLVKIVVTHPQGCSYDANIFFIDNHSCYTRNMACTQDVYGNLTHQCGDHTKNKKTKDGNTSQTNTQKTEACPSPILLTSPQNWAMLCFEFDELPSPMTTVLLLGGLSNSVCAGCLPQETIMFLCFQIVQITPKKAALHASLGSPTP